MAARIEVLSKQNSPLVHYSQLNDLPKVKCQRPEIFQATAWSIAPLEAGDSVA